MHRIRGHLYLHLFFRPPTVRRDPAKIQFGIVFVFRSGNDKSSRHVADENNNNYDNIPLKSILKTSRFNKNKQRNNNSNITSTTTNEGKTSSSSSSISSTRKQRTSDRSETKVNVNSNNTNENVEAINNNKNSNVDSSMNNNESKYSENSKVCWLRIRP